MTKLNKEEAKEGLENTEKKEDLSNDQGDKNTQSEEAKDESKQSKEDELGSGLKGYDDKFKNIYGKFKHQERMNSELIDANKKLINKLDTKMISEEEEKLNSELAGIEREMDDAYENDEKEKYHAAKEKLRDTLEKKSRFSVKKESDQQNISDNNKSINDHQKALNDFKNWNPWFNGESESDREMTDESIKIDSEMKADPNWVNQPHDAFFRELSRRTLESYRVKSNPYINKAAVGGISQGSSGNSNNSEIDTSKLTSMQKEVAEKMLPHLPANEAHKKYAKNLL